VILGPRGTASPATIRHLQQLQPSWTTSPSTPIFSLARSQVPCGGLTALARNPKAAAADSLNPSSLATAEADSPAATLARNSIRHASALARSGADRGPGRQQEGL
jgi:hypothetical protein